MIIKSITDVEKLILGDAWRMKVLRAAHELNLPDWWIGAGFLRGAVWDAIEGKPPTMNRDVDVVYFNADDIAPETDWAYDEQMKLKYPFAEWEVRNQARMHYKSYDTPFTSTEDGIAHWVETATCVAVRFDGAKLDFLFCYGTDDLFNLVARPIPYFQAPERIDLFRKRIKEKQWLSQWPHLKVLESD